MKEYAWVAPLSIKKSSSEKLLFWCPLALGTNELGVPLPALAMAAMPRLTASGLGLDVAPFAELDLVFERGLMLIPSALNLGVRHHNTPHVHVPHDTHCCSYTQ